MNEQEHRAGILSVSRPMVEAAKLALPPEHKIAAISKSFIEGAEDWLVEGPLMPVVKPGRRPLPVNVIFTVNVASDGSVTITAFVSSSNAEYVVGTWPSREAFRADWPLAGG